MRKTEDHRTIGDKLAQPVPFFREGSDAAEFWACGSCGVVHPHEINARRCYTCAPKPCPTCEAWVPARDYCRPCADARAEAKSAEAFAEATKIAEADYRDLPVFDQDGEFHRSIECLVDCLDPGDEQPAWVFAATQVTPAGRFGREIEIDDILTGWSEAVGEIEGYVLEWDDVRTFKSFISSWLSMQSAAWFEEDRSFVVVLEARPPEEDTEAGFCDCDIRALLEGGAHTCGRDG